MEWQAPLLQRLGKEVFQSTHNFSCKMLSRALSYKYHYKSDHKGHAMLEPSSIRFSL